MAGMQFEYDEEGGTFFYFLLSFWALGLFPATYFCWPRAKESADETTKKKGVCNCEPCIKKNIIRKQEEASIKPLLTKVVLAIGWLIFFLLAYKVSMIQIDYVEYDPFTVLGIDRGATDSEIRKAYRSLSRIHHPDMETGDEKSFMRIAKAYAALTDAESKENWEKYGNPDGPEATRFGIALPKWIVERENSMWVLAVYGLVFMIILPIVVGVWWYRSIKFSSDQVLLDTTRLYYYFINKTPNMILKRAVMILAASCEFDRMHNAEVQDRASDNEELPQLIKILGNIQEKNRERPLCFPYSVKTRVLLHAHFQRRGLNQGTLGADQTYILKKCPYLVNEMINICASLVAMAMSGRVHQPPRLETIENLMKLSQMMIQAMEEKASPMLMLPHINSEMLRYFSTRKRSIRHLRDFVSMKDEERRQMLRSLGDGEYQDIMQVAGSMPYIQMDIRSEVLDEEDSTITVGSIVTVTVRLTRKNLSELFDHEIPAIEQIDDDENGNGDEDGDEDEDHDEKGVAAGGDGKAKGWVGQQKKGKKKGGKAKKKTKQPYQWKAAAQAKVDKENAIAAAAAKSTDGAKAKGGAGAGAAGGGDSEDHDDEEAEAESGEENNASDAEEQDSNKEGEADTADDSKVEEKVEEKAEEKAVEKRKAGAEDEDEDEDWDTFKMESKKENSLETKKKESHTVHCPHFPADKQEAWWLYVADKKRHLLITAPVHVCSLKEEEEVKLKFSAPAKQGVYHYTVVLKSDSYYSEFDDQHNIKLDVKEAKIVKDHPQWDISDDEEGNENNEDESEEEEDSDYSSEDDGSE